MSDIGSRGRSTAKSVRSKTNASASPSKVTSLTMFPSIKPSKAFWDKLEERESELCDEQILITTQKCIARVVKSEDLVSSINQQILERRNVNDLSRVASLRIEVKAAEKKWKYFTRELHKYLDGDDLPPGKMRDEHLLIAQELFDRHDEFFDTEKPRPPSPPNGPMELYSGPYSGNRYDGSYLPWKRERHGEGQIKYGDGTRIVGTFFRDQLHGAATIFFNDRVRVFVGGWRHGQRYGHGILEAKHGVQYISWEGTWKKGLPNGLGTYTTRSGHKIFGEWRKPRLMHGGLTIKFNYVKLHLPGRADGVFFEGKAELENAENMRLRVLRGEKAKLYREYGSVEEDRRLTKKMERQVLAKRNEKPVNIQWLCHVCFYQNGESDDDSDDDTDEYEVESETDSDESIEDESEEEEEEDDYDDEEGEDEEEEENLINEDDEMDINLFWKTGEISSIWDARSHISSDHHNSTSFTRQQLQRQNTKLQEEAQALKNNIKEELIRQAKVELTAWMVENGISLEHAEVYNNNLSFSDIVDKDAMLYVNELTELWRSSTLKKLQEEYKFKQQDAESIIRAFPFSVNLNEFEHHTLEDDPPSSLPSTSLQAVIRDPSPFPTSGTGVVELQTSSNQQVASLLQQGEPVYDGSNTLLLHHEPNSPLTPTSFSNTNTLTIREGDNEEEDDDDDDDDEYGESFEGKLEPPATDPYVLNLKVEELISNYKNAKPYVVKASQFFKLPKRMSSRSRSFHRRQSKNEFGASLPSLPGSPTRSSPTRNFSSPSGHHSLSRSFSSGKSMGSNPNRAASPSEAGEFIVRKCRSCACPDTAQLRLGPLGRLRAAKMIDPLVYPRNVVHVRARREMAKDIWLGQPYDPNAFKFNKVN